MHNKLETAMNLIKSMQIFKQVIEDKSFSRAAENLNLVPSAVSRQINELESWMGVRLINRTTRSLNLTDEGHRYLLKVDEILSQVDELKYLQDDKNTLTGTVRLTAPIMLGQHDIQQVISKFNLEHPDVQISLTLINHKVNLVEEGYDLAIRAGHLADSSFYARKIGSTAFKTVASKDYLAKQPKLNTPYDLAHHNCLINTSRASPRRWTYNFDGASKPVKVKVKGNIETNDSSCILSFAKDGHGIALLPDRYVDNDIQSGVLIEVLSEYAPEPLPINIVYHSSKLMSATLKALIDFIRHSFTENSLIK